MKKRLLFLFVVVFVIGNLSVGQASAQTPNCLWAKSEGGTSTDYGFRCSTDANGNIIATGYFTSSSITFGTTTLINDSAGTPDIFIVKYDVNGNVIWAQRAGGTYYDYGNSFSPDANGNIIVTGYFESSSITFGTTTLSNAGNSDMFIVKYDANGNVLWAERAGETSIDAINGCSTDTSGNIIVTGYFYSAAISFGTTVLSNAGADDIFIAKYDANGNVLWAQCAGGTSTDAGNSCSTDASGNIIAIGSFSSSSIAFGTNVLINAGNSDIFIVKYDTNGNVIWAKSAGGTSYDNGFSSSIDASGNVIVIGSYAGSSITLGTTVLASAGGVDMFIVKYDANGNILWAKSAGGTSGDQGLSCSADASGNFIATGCFHSPTITFGTTTLTNADSSGYTPDIFIVKYDANGNTLWAQRAGGIYNDGGYSCSTDANGNIIATGYFVSPAIAFGTDTLTNVGPLGYSDMFIVKLSGATGIGIEENNFENTVNVYPNPFSSSTAFEIVLSKGTNVSLKIVDVMGKEVADLLDEHKSSGELKITFDRNSLASGIYFYQLQIDDSIKTGKLIIN